jgi:L-lactate dehydrogenase complex protein LldG
MTMSEARTEILAKIRHASRGASAQEVAADLARLGQGPTALLPDPDLPTALMINILKNRGSVDIARDRSEAVQAIGRYLYDRFRSQKLVAGNDHRLAALPWRDAGLLPRFGSAEDGDAAALSYAHAAVAETGSVVILTGKANPSANNLLPEDHIVLVDCADLVADLDQAWQRVRALSEQSGIPRGVNIISGPSSTADIAQQLVKGAHGPRNWHVILIGDVTADSLARARELAGL